jgi:hypothetical protein
MQSVAVRERASRIENSAAFSFDEPQGRSGLEKLTPERAKGIFAHAGQGCELSFEMVE